jgi:hypothetical protein
MLKAIILSCTFCAGTGGAVLWLTSGSNALAQSAAYAGGLSIQEMHANAHMDGLPIQTFRPQ